MFDAETTSLIRSASPLPGLDPEGLPARLTQAYSRVVAARLRLSSGEPPERGAAWLDNLRLLAKLAETYEAITIFLDEDNEHRPGSAFVAGSAHTTLHQMQLVTQGGDVASPHDSLAAHAVGSDVAAALLFLAGGQQADAAEAAKGFKPPNGVTEEELVRRLLGCLAALASGEGEQLKLLAETDAGATPRLDKDYLASAVAAAWHELVLVTQEVARRLLDLPGDDPRTRLRGLIARLSQGGQVDGTGFNATVRLPLSGPYHLARLLTAAVESLLASAVTGTSPPGGIEEEDWRDVTRDFATRKPLLWRNHRKALDQGFLNQGESFVVTFPTGAGKTAITELRIAAALLRGQAVVYLAPTKALIRQVRRDLSPMVRAASANRGFELFLEDLGERAGNDLLIQTPEQCLAFLAYNEDAFGEVGLIVVDECHQLSAPPPDQSGVRPPPDRRSLDAMWALLSLLERSPAADVILISAMVRNGQELADWLARATQRPATSLDLEWKPTRQVRGVVAYDAGAVSKLKERLAEARAQGDRARAPGVADLAGVEASPSGLFCHTQVWDPTSTFAEFPLLGSAVPLTVNKQWRLTANRNFVAGKLLGAMALTGMRPLVFSQQVTWTRPIAERGAQEIENAKRSKINLSDDEEALFDAAAVELGDPMLVQRPIRNVVGVHHGQLLLSERAAMESAFQRSDGLYALVATPTVAQGINLPAEAVIIAGDDRWVDKEGDVGRTETLAVHEVLNAAGRAGRAGRYAHGVVVSIPGKVFTVQRNAAGQFEFDGLRHVMNLFGTPDQCLDVADPITYVLDQIQQGTNIEVGEYLIRRAGGVEKDQLRRMLAASLGNAAGDQAAPARVDEQLDTIARSAAALDVSDKKEGDELELEEWRDLASRAGVSPTWLAQIALALPSLESLSNATFASLLGLHLDFLTEREGMFFGLVEPSSADLDRILPLRVPKKATKRTPASPGETLEAWEARWRDALREAAPRWLGGEPLKDVGATLLDHRDRGVKKGRAKAPDLGRRFALQGANGVAFGISLVSRTIERSNKQLIATEFKDRLRLVSGCVREGFDHPDKLLLFWSLRARQGLYPRVRVHEVFEDLIEGELPSWEEVPDVTLRQELITDLVDSNLG